MFLKRLVFIVFFVMGYLGSTMASPQQLHAQNGKDEYSLKVYQVESLQFTEDILQTILEGRQSTKMQGDPARGTIAIYTDREGHALVEKSLNEIETSSRSNRQLPPTSYEVIELMHSEARFTAQLVEQLKERNTAELGRVAIDPRNNSLIVSGSEEYVESVRKLVGKIDVASSESKNVEQINCTLSLTWIVDTVNLKQDRETLGKLREVPVRFEPMVEALVKSDAVVTPKMLTQVRTMIMVSGAEDPGKFEIQSNAHNLQMLGDASLKATGTVIHKDDNRFEVSIKLSLESDQVASSRLMSTFVVKEDHPVAFSVSDFGGIPSVLVVEVVKSPIEHE